MDKFIMSLDLGTTSARCIIFDRKGKARGMARRPLKCFFPEEGFVEQSPEEFSDAIRASALEALLKAKTSAARIESIGITNQRETVILWDRATGKPVANAYSWQCSRGVDLIEALTDAQRETIRKKTGLIPSPYFSASKIAWGLRHIPGLRERAEAGEIAFGTPDSWLIYKLTGGKSHLTDYTNASRTMLFNINELSWDEELLRIFDIPKAVLPEARPSANVFGEAQESFFGALIPIAGVAGDQQSALFGQRCFKPGEVKNTYGTGCFMLMNTGERRIDSESGLLTTIAAGAGEKQPEYALEGSVFLCGALLDWLRDGLGIISSAAETGKMAQSLPDNGGVYMVPALSGLGAPYWNSEAKGLITGLTRKSGREHIVRAALEGIAYQSRDVLAAMEEDTGFKTARIRTDGGVGRSDFLMQFQADITNTSLLRPTFAESTAMGAAYLAGLSCGFWKSQEELLALESEVEEFRPVMSEGERSQLLAGWRKALDQTGDGSLSGRVTGSR